MKMKMMKITDEQIPAFTLTEVRVCLVQGGDASFDSSQTLIVPPLHVLQTTRAQCVSVSDLRARALSLAHQCYWSPV